MSRRRWPWVLGAIIVLPFALQVYAQRPRASMAEQAEAYSAKRVADPATAPAEAAVKSALNALRAVTAAPDLALQANQRWLEDRVSRTDDDRDDVPPAAQRAVALQHQATFWREAAAQRPDPDSLAHTCVYQVPYAPCTVTGSGEVPGSGGTLRYQAAGRAVMDATGPDADRRFAANEAAALVDPMVGGTIDVFATDPAGGWHMVLAYSGKPTEQPTQVDTPAGRLLVVTRDDHSPPILYALLDGRWRYLYQAAWMQALAAKAPPGTCLDGGFYLGQWPWPKQLIPVLSRIKLDVASLSVDSAYFADGAKVALVHATVAPQADELVLRSADVQTMGSASLWTRLFGRCRGAG